MIETFQVINTKSTLLMKIIEKSIKISEKFEDIEIGSLIKLEKVKFELINEDELKMVKMIKNNFLDGIKTLETEDYDLNKLSKAVLKDYSYKLKGSYLDEEFRIKIPLSFENEFENDYNIEDLLIGEVELIGIYKGEIEEKKLMNTLDYLMENEEKIFSKHIKSSQKKLNEVPKKNNNENGKIIFIDILAIIQDIKIKEEKNSENIEGGKKIKNESKSTSLFNKIICQIKRLFRK